MRELLLFRHAKALRDLPEARDHERDLAPRGERAARQMGELLVEHGVVPDLILCSTARRTVRTVELAAKAWASQPSVRFLKPLYLAAPSRLLETVQRQSASVGRLMVVGHNPGLQQLALGLVAKDDAVAASGRLAQKFPTAALALVAFDVEDWGSVQPASGRLVALWKPRDLEA